MEAQRTAAIELTLVGRRGLEAAYDAEVDALLARQYQGSSSPDAYRTTCWWHAIAACHATVYPSWEEGFGLPVGESLWLGRPLPLP